MKIVNDLIYVNPITAFINKDNVLDILKEHDVVIDAVDNIETRFYYKKVVRNLKYHLFMVLLQAGMDK